MDKKFPPKARARERRERAVSKLKKQAMDDSLSQPKGRSGSSTSQPDGHPPKIK